MMAPTRRAAALWAEAESPARCAVVRRTKVEGRRQDNCDDMLWTEKFEIEDGPGHRPRALAHELVGAPRSHDISCSDETTCDLRDTAASSLWNAEKGCQAVPGVCHPNPLKTNDRGPKRVSRFCDVFESSFSDFQCRRFVQNRRPERPEGAEGHRVSRRFYSTMLPNRIRCNSLKLNARRLGYSTINRGSLEPSLTASFAPPRLNSGHQNV